MKLPSIFNRPASGTVDRAAPYRREHTDERPEDFHPTHHEPIAPPVDHDAMVALVEHHIQRFEAAGALDAGTPDVLDRFLEYQRRSWELPIEQHSTNRRQTAATFVMKAEQRVALAQAATLKARADARHWDGQRAYWSDVLLGVADSPPPATLTDNSAEAAETAPRPNAADKPAVDLTGPEWS